MSKDFEKYIEQLAQDLAMASLPRPGCLWPRHAPRDSCSKGDDGGLRGRADGRSALACWC